MAKKKNSLPTYEQYTKQNPSVGNPNRVTYEQYKSGKTSTQPRVYQSQTNTVKSYIERLKQQKSAQANALKNAYQDAAHSQNGDQRYQLYAAKMMLDTPGAIEKEKERQLNNSRKETEKMKQLSQDLTYGYGGRYDPSLAYQARQMGVSADKVRGFVEKDNKAYQALQRLEKEYNAQNALTFQGVKNARKQNGTGTDWTLEQQFNLEGQRRQNQAQGLNDNGYDPFHMSAEGRQAYRNRAEQEAAARRAKIQEYEQYDPDKALSYLYETMYNRDLANEQAILDNPVYRGTDFERNAQAKKAELESGYNEGWRRAYDNAQRLIESGQDLDSMTEEEIYNLIMPDSYRDRTKTNRDLQAVKQIINDFRTGLKTPWGEGSQGDAISALQREAGAFDSVVNDVDKAQKYYDMLDRFQGLADSWDLETGYNAALLPAQPQMYFDDRVNDYVPVPQGDEIDQAYWWANNYQTLNGLQDRTDITNKYMFIAQNPEILKMFNEFYAKDKENQLDRLHGLRSSNYAQQFLEGLDPYLTTMLVEYQNNVTRSRAEDPFAGTVTRLAGPWLNIVGGIEGTIGAITGQGLDSPLYWTSRIVSETRSQQNEDVAEWANRVIGDGSGDVAQFMLGVIDSIADNVAAMGTGTAIAGQGTKGAMRLVQLIMSGSATSNKMIESLGNGMDPTEAALYAVGDGIIEWLTERYSLERIMGPDVRQLYGNKRAMATFLARSAGAEGSEEIASGLLNTGLDSILSMIYGHEDEIKKRYNELVTKEGKTDAEASRIAMEEKLREIGLEGLAGAISGLGMAGSRVITTAMETGRQGQTLQSKDGGLDTMLKLAQQMKEGTESRTLADQLAAEMEKGSAVSNYDLGRLANLTAIDVGDTRSQVIRDTVGRNVQQQLMDAGIGEQEAKQYGAIITRSIFEGKRLSKEDIQTLGQDERAIKFWGDFNTMSQASRNLAAEVKAETKPLDSIADKVSDLITPETEQESAAAAAVQESMKAADTMEEAIDNLQAKNSGLLSENFAKLVKDELASNPVLKKSKTYLDDMMKIRLAAMTGDSMPRTALDKDVAQRFFDAAKAEFDEVDADRVVPQAPAMEGQGKATFNGAEYGTDAWKQATEGFSKWTRNVMGAVGEIAARFGYRVNLVNDPENKDVYGFEDANTGAITINVANGFKHHMLVTMAHEMTHWLEQNSRGGYNDLRSFVLESLRKEGVNVQERIVKIMDNYNMVMKPEAGKGMTINQAMAELVAQSSEGLLSSRRAAMELQSINPTLYGRVQNYVKNIVARLDAAIHSMEYEASMSQEAKALRNYREQLADIWFTGRKDAQGQQGPIITPEAPQAEEGERFYFISSEEGAPQAEEGERFYFISSEEGAPQAEKQTEVRNEAEKPQNVQYSVADMGEEKGNKKGSLSAAADPLSPASTSETTAGITSESIVTQEEEDVKRAQEEKLDEEYMQAIADGDEKKQLQMIRDKLMNAEGIYPFYAPQLYKGHAVKIARAIKAGDMKVITTAAGEMAKYVPDNAVLIPMPGHTGIVTDDTDTMLLAKELSRITGKPVINALQGNERESRYVSKSKNRKGVTAEQMGFRQIRNLPEGAIPVIIDNVVAVGETAKAAIDAIPGSTVLSYAKGATENVARGLKAAFATKDKEGNWIPLSKKGDINNPNWRYSVAQRDENYMKAVESGNVEEQQHLVDEAAKEAGYIKAGYHGTLSGGFTIFDKAKAGIGGNSGAGFYFSSSEEDSESNYSDVEGADNYFKWSNLAEKMQEALGESGEEEIEYKGHTITEDMTYEELQDIAKEILNKKPEVYNVYLNPGNTYIRDFDNSTNLVEDVIDGFDESLIDRDDYENDDDYEEALYQAKDEELYEAINKAVYGAIYDIESNYELYSNINQEEIVGDLIQIAADYQQLTWDDLIKVLQEKYIDLGTLDGTAVTDGTHEIARAIVENFGYDSIEDREVSQKFNQIKKMYNTEDAVHYIMFRPEQIKLADPVTYDDAGNVILPSQRFNEKQKDIRYSIAQMDKDYQAAVDSGNVEEQRRLVREAAENAGYDVKNIAYHGTDSFGFTVFDMETSQGQIFVSYNQDTAKTYANDAQVRTISSVVDANRLSGEEIAKKLYELDENIENPEDSKYYTYDEFIKRKETLKNEYVSLFDDERMDEDAIDMWNNDIVKGLENQHYKNTQSYIITDKNITYKGLALFLADKLNEMKGEIKHNETLEKLMQEYAIDFSKEGTELWPARKTASDLYEMYKMNEERVKAWGGIIKVLNNRRGKTEYISTISASNIIRMRNSNGLYEFFTKPGKQLVVDARDDYWNNIPFNTKNAEFTIDENGVYEYVLDPETKEKMDMWGTDYPHSSTRRIAEWAQEHGFDSVRINNVYDNGGRGKSKAYGDIGIFFNQEDVKSADPVTYDDNGNVIKPSERFTESNDLRYSIAQSPDMEVNNFMMGLNEFNLPTYQEKTMLRQYKDARTRAELLRYGIREREAERRKLLAMEKRGLKENKRLSQINDFLARDRARLNQLEKTLVDVTREKGYARLMMNQKNLMDNLVSGRTAGELEETVNNIQKNLDDVTREMAERAENLKKLASAEAVLKIRQMFDARGLKAIAAKLKNDLGSELENKEIENRLAMIALKMKEGKYDAETAEELADLLAGRMQGEYEGYFISELRGSTITLGPAQLKELKGSGRSLSDIRQQLAGTGIRIGTKGSTTLDAKWDELCDIFPTLDRNESAGNMLDVLLDKITSEKNEQPTVYNNEQLMDTNRMILEAAQKLIPEIITDENSLKLIRETMAFVAKVSGAAKSSAEAMDDINAMISQLQKKSSKAIVTARKLTGDIGETLEYFDQLSLQSEAAMWKQERIRLIDQLKSDNTKALMEEADRWREKIEKDKAFRELAGENLHTRRKITTNVSRLRKLLINETDLKNIPEHMKGLAREMLGKIVDNDLARRKLTGIDRKDLAETGRVLAEMKKLDGDFTPDDLRLIADEEAQAVIMDALADLEEGLEEYNSHRTGTMMDNANAVKETLDKISDAVSKITGIINAERSVAFLDRQVTVGEAADDVRKDFQNSRFKGELAGRGSKAVNTVKRTVVYGNMTPEYYIENLRNKGMTELWQDAKRGENRNGLEVRRAKERIGQLAEETGYKAWADEKKEVTLGGRKRTLKIGSIMELYAIWKREHTSNPEMSQHLAKGGVFFQEDNEQDKEGVIRHVRTEQRAVRVTDEEIQAMYDSLTEQQKQLIDGVVKYLSSDMSDLGNEASMRMYGIKKYKETYYFPMKVWDGVKAARSDKGITGTTENRSAHYSWSKRRQHMASNALVIGDFMTDAINHIVEMINYNTMAPAIENINKVLNYKFTEDVGTDDETKRTLRAMFQENYGTESLKYMEQLLQDMNGGPAQDQRKTLRDRALSIFKKNAVAGSMSVALQQPLSYIRAAMMINPKYLTEGLAKFWKGSYQEMISHSGVAVIKDMGKFDMNFGQSAKDYIMPETKKSLYRKTTDVLTVAPQMMDTMTWTRMWSAVKAEQAAKNPGMDTKSEAFLNLVTERFNDLVRKTQVYDSVLVKSSNMRSQNLGMKVITSFMAEPTLSLNVLADAIRNTDLQGGKAKLAKAGATFLVSAVMQAVVKGLLGSGRTPDRKKTWLENFLNKLQYNLMNEASPVSLIPGYSDLIEVLKTGELKDDAMSAIGKLFSIGDTIKKAAQGNGKGWYRDIEDTAAQFAQLFTNIPAKNLMRDMRAVYNWISGTEYASRPTSGNVLKYQAEANLYSGDNLLGALNAWLGEAGFKTTAASYYGRIYNAMKNGDQGTAEGLKEYMSLAKGTSDEAIKTGLKTAAKKDRSLTDAQRDSWMIKNDLMGKNNTSTITTQYKEGKISAAEARKLWKELEPSLTDNDLYWKQDWIDYQKQTGIDVSNSYTYRLKDAVASNKGDNIRKAVKDMLDHGRTQKQVKDALSDWKSTYLAGDQKARSAIRNALQIAYKALGLTAADADKTIEGWKKSEKKTKK